MSVRYLTEWTEEHDKKLIELSQTHSIREIAREMNASVNGIRSQRLKLRKQGYDIPHLRRRPWWDEDKEAELIKLSQSMKPAELAEHFGVTVKAIQHKQAKLRYAGKLDSFKTDKPRWDEEEHIKLLDMANSGELTVDEIAEKLERSKTTVRIKLYEMGFKFKLDIPTSKTPVDWSDEVKEQVKEIALTGATIEHIANETGVSYLRLLSYQIDEEYNNPPVIEANA